MEATPKQNTLQTLFLLKQHVLPRMRETIDAENVASAAPLIREPCVNLGSYLGGTIRNIATQFRESNVTVLQRFKMINDTNIYDTIKEVMYRYIDGMPRQRLTLLTPVILWERDRSGAYHGVVPANESTANLEYMRPAMDDILRILLGEDYAIPPYRMRVVMPYKQYVDLPERFVADMVVHVTIAAGSDGLLMPFLVADVVKWRDGTTKYIMDTIFINQ